MEFITEIKSGRLSKVIPIQDGSYLVTIKKKNNRSLPQNAYYHGCIIPEFKRGLYELGYDFSSQDVHEFLKDRFLKKQIANEQTGEFLEVPGSTAGLSTIEFNEFISKCQQFAAEYLNIVIPDPNSQVSIW